MMCNVRALYDIHNHTRAFLSRLSLSYPTRSHPTVPERVPPVPRLSPARASAIAQRARTHTHVTSRSNRYNYIELSLSMAFSKTVCFYFLFFFRISRVICSYCVICQISFHGLTSNNAIYYIKIISVKYL